MSPLLSIVIANYNYGRFLEEAIQSVLSQSCKDFEIIICDAASTDNSVDVIRKYEDKLAWWCSEKDGGQSAAFNKGFSHASGCFLTWLNADDVMLPGTVEKLKIAAERHPECEWFVGGSIWTDPEMKVASCHPARSFSKIRARCGQVSVWGPSSFFSRRLFDAVGGIDERFHYKMDSDLWVRFFCQGIMYRPFIKYAYALRMHPEAKMSGHNFAGSSSHDPNHPKWAQIRLETSLIAKHCDARPLTRFRRLITMRPMALLCGYIDGLRMKGEVVK